MELRVSELAERIGAELRGDSSVVVCAVGPLDGSGDKDVAFIESSKYRSLLDNSLAGAVITYEFLDGFGRPQLKVDDVNASLIEVLTIFAPKLKPPVAGVAETAKVCDGVILGDGVCVEPFAFIEEDVEIGAGSVIGSGCKIGQGSKIGSNSRLYSNVVVYHNCVIGSNVVIQSNSTIGSIGFGYSFIDGGHRLIPHNGGVVIEDFVDIGANCCIDRAKFGDTLIGAGSKLDNLVQISHNVVMGKCCVIAGQVALAGSCKLGNGVVLGGRSGLSDHVTLGDGVMVGGCSVAFKDFPAGSKLFGLPAMESRSSLRITSLTRRLPRLFEEVRQLKEKVKGLEASKDD